MPSKAEITILLLNYRRPENLRRILLSIAAQTLSCQVFLWNNGAETDIETGVTWQVQSSINVGCWPRWLAAGFAETEFVCSLDDDLSFRRPDALHTIISTLSNLGEPDVAIGIEGVVLNPDRHYYVPNQNVGYHLRSANLPVQVDIVKGRFLACRTSALAAVSIPPHEREDDIAICGQLARGRARHHLLPAKLHQFFEELPQGGLGNFSQAEHCASRERARRRYFSS